MAVTHHGSSGLSAVRHVVEEANHVKEPAPIPSHRGMDSRVIHAWVNQRRWLNATSKSAMVRLHFQSHIIHQRPLSTGKKAKIHKNSKK